MLKSNRFPFLKALVSGVPVPLVLTLKVQGAACCRVLTEPAPTVGWVPRLETHAYLGDRPWHADSSWPVQGFPPPNGKMFIISGTQTELGCYFPPGGGSGTCPAHLQLARSYAAVKDVCCSRFQHQRKRKDGHSPLPLLVGREASV